jgi:hypothetical protein
MSASPFSDPPAFLQSMLSFASSFPFFHKKKYPQLLPAHLQDFRLACAPCPRKDFQL